MFRMYLQSRPKSISCQTQGYCIVAISRFTLKGYWSNQGLARFRSLAVPGHCGDATSGSCCPSGVSTISDHIGNITISQGRVLRKLKQNETCAPRLFIGAARTKQMNLLVQPRPHHPTPESKPRMLNSRSKATKS